MKPEVEWIIRGLKKPGKTRSGIAKALGLRPSAITDLLSGSRRLRASEIPIIASYLEISPAESLPTNKNLQYTKPNATFGAPVDFPTAMEVIPVYGQALGGPDGCFVLNGSRVDEVLAPPTLRNVPDAYAVFVVGDSMEPRYRAGEIAYIHPHLPVRRGDYVVVQIKGAAEGDPPSGYIKEFISLNSEVLRLHQLNPSSDIQFAASEVVSVHKIILAG